MGGGLIADDFSADASGMSLVLESSPEEASILEVSDDQKKPPRTLVLLGRSGNGKSATGNSILGRRAFKSKGSASGVTTSCELQSSALSNGQILNVIDTPGLFSLSPSTEFTCREILNCFYLSKEGIDAVLVVFSLRNRLTEEEKSALFALRILFGSEITGHMIVVFTNEDALEDDGQTMEEYLNDSSDFKEILNACNDRKVLFRNSANALESQKSKQIQELVDYVEEIARRNGKPYMGDISHKGRENEKMRIFGMKGFFTKEEMSYDDQKLRQMMETMEAKLKGEQTRLEQRLNEEHAARLELEKKANKADEHSSEVIKKLREDLQMAEKMTKELKEKWCTIL